MKRYKFLCRTIAAISALSTISSLCSCGGNSGDHEFDAVADEKYIENNLTPEKESAPKTEPEKTAATVSPEKDLTASATPGRLPVRNIGQLHKVFNDSNHVQLKHAQAIGIDPIYNIRDAYRTRRPVVYVRSNEYYHVDTLKHSLPFLVPEAEKLLRDIGKNFIDSLQSRGGEGYIIKVTSMLRTPGTVKKLQRVNINATGTSTHQFGTTFDISYTKFYPVGNPREIHDGDLKNLLAEVLSDMRDKGRCLVKFERKTSCFHVTVTR